MDAQSLQTFSQFVSFVKNVDNYTAIVDQLKQATDAHTAAFDKLTQGKTLVQFQVALDAVKARLNAERTSFDSACKAQNDVLAQRAKDLDAREEDLNALSNIQSNLKIQLANQSVALDSISAALDKREQDLNSQIAANNKVAQDLADKAQRLSAILN